MKVRKKGLLGSMLAVVLVAAASAPPPSRTALQSRAYVRLWRILGTGRYLTT